MLTKQRLGELLIEKNLVTEKDIEAALKLQVSGNRRLGTILVKMGCVDAEKLLDVLSKQQGVPRVNIDKEFDSEVKKVLPKYLCRKYSMIPLNIDQDKNVLKVAMVDPLDDEAVSDAERYTGLAVWGVPATEGEVEEAIAQNIPFSSRDIFNPQTYNTFTKVASIAALMLALVTISFVYNYLEREKYGIISQLQEETIYRNHDLIVSFEKQGKISLLGHGAYADGYYAVLFNDKDSFLRFMDKKKDKFSEKQLKWLTWVSEQNFSRNS
jgi:hypothetical protein